MKEATEPIRQKLMESIFEVFEKMLFVFLEPSEEPGSNFEIGASIQFQDDRLKGDCRIWMSQKLAGSMAHNLLGIEEERVTAKCAEDCVVESVNMICGNFLAKFDSARTFNLSIPVLVTEGPDGFEAGENRFRLDFDSDHGKMAATLTIHPR